MTILAIETSTKVCSAALAVSGRIVAARIDRDSGNHAKQLPLFVEELLAVARERKLQIDAVALSEGPGSYTGLRIGTSTAKGLCYGLDIPLIPIPTTEVLCANAEKRLRVSEYELQNIVLCPMIDARRMEVYTARYDKELQPLTDIQACIVEGRESLGVPAGDVRGCLFFGDGAAKCRELLESEKWHFVADIIPDAACMADIAQKRLEAGKVCQSASEIAYYEPFYLKEFVAAKSHVKGLD